ncbi:MAG: ABC transporter substrate-binding protein [Desulfarculus sp.]|jgi:branched-chain amino acid transport system substrate-binding protein|nr:MAG: ABC transporter substrate-binding protein [Desulfarculus sp.]
MRRLGVLGSVLLAAVLLVGLCGTAQAVEPIKIGVAGPMSFTQGQGHWNGATLAAMEINAKGGVKVGNVKRPIELIKVDTNEFMSIPDATNAMELAITRHKVDFLVGGFRSEAVLVMQDIAMDNKKIFLGCGAAHPELCTRVTKNYNRYKYWFRITPINSKFLGKVIFIQLGTVAAMMKQAFGLKKLSVAIIAEKAAWNEPIVAAAQAALPKMGMKVAGVWRPSPVAKDVTAELGAIQRSGANIIFTSFSASVGIPFAKQWGELQVPAPVVGINVEAQKDGFWAATGGKGEFTQTLNTYARVKMTEHTIPFFDAYMKNFKEAPNYTAGTYDAVLLLAWAVEKAGTLNSDKVVPVLEKSKTVGTAGLLAFSKDHDVIWGPGYVTSLGTQWQGGKNMAVWPYKWEGITFEGTVPVKFPPWVIKRYKK